MKQRTNKKFIIPPSCILFKDRSLVDIDKIYKIEYNKKERLSIIFSYVDGNKETIYFDQLLNEPSEDFCNKIANNILYSKMSRNRWLDNENYLIDENLIRDIEIPGVISWK